MSGKWYDMDDPAYLDYEDEEAERMRILKEMHDDPWRYPNE